MIVFFIAPPIIGVLTGWSPVVIIPSGILIVYFFGEILRHYKRRKIMSKTKPVEYRAQSKRATWITTQKICIRQYKIEKSAWNGEHFRIVSLSDFHLDSQLPFTYYESCITKANCLLPDIILLTGDFVDRIVHTDRLQALLKRLKAKHGVFAVLGNHDYYAGQMDVLKAISVDNVQILSGRCIRVKTVDGAFIEICGTEHPWGKDFLADRKQTTPSDLKVVLSHSPDYVFGIQNENIDMVFSGHLHGGQWQFPILGPLVAPSRRGRIFDFGHYEIGRVDLFITSGIGLSWLPIRVRCEPEILVVDVNGAKPINSADIFTS